MTYRIIQSGESRSFPTTHDFLNNAQSAGLGVVHIGINAPTTYQSAIKNQNTNVPFIAIELGNECLGVHIDDDNGPNNVVGFARFRLGIADPTNLVELVRMPYTSDAAIEAARSAFEAAGLKVAVCNDFPGRILNRLVRPYYNAALRRLDEGLATAADMDTTLKLGLGYPEGPISLLTRTGLDDHFNVTQALYDQLGQEGYVAARRARNAWLKSQPSGADDATT